MCQGHCSWAPRCACLLQTHHFPPVSMHTCQREVGNPLLIVPFGTWYMPWISGRAGYLQKSTKPSLQPTPMWVKAWKLYCKWIIAFLLFLFKAGKKKNQNSLLSSVRKAMYLTGNFNLQRWNGLQKWERQKKCESF